MSNNNKILANKFDDQYTSLIRPIKIFLPPRKEEGEESKYEDFVGRERLMERLFLWISDRKQKSGSYLVTGFRGMGKTSLVERTTERLTRETNSKVEILSKISLLLVVLSVGFIVIGGVRNNHSSIFIICGIVGFLISVLLISVSCTYNDPKRQIKHLRKRISNRKDFRGLFINRIVRGKRTDVSQKDFSNIKISVNLGHEILKERDVLGLIATNVRDKYKQYIKWYKSRWLYCSTC